MSTGSDTPLGSSQLNPSRREEGGSLLEEGGTTTSPSVSAPLDWSGGVESESITVQFRASVRAGLEPVLHSLRSDLVACLVNSLRNKLELSEDLGAVDPPTAQEWLAVESLSKLRAVVGGRYANVKRKWVDAGLPLRLHRGDRSLRPNVEGQGWLELSNWIRTQGFEARLSPDDPEALLYVKLL